MNRSGLFLACALLPGLPLDAQEPLKVDHTHSCCYTGKLDPSIKLYSFKSDADAREAVERIMAYSGLEPNFQVLAANVDNAAAIIKGDQRLILYSQAFMERIKNEAMTDWAAYAIMAHEIGHHLQGHTLTATGSRPSIELQADKYSGYVLGLMGASLDQAVSALKTLPPGPGSKTHPSRSARLASGTNGWKKAQETLNQRPKPSPERVPKLSELSIKLPSTANLRKLIIKPPKNYQATLGILAGEVDLTWYEDGRVTGSYRYPGGKRDLRTLTGSNPKNGVLLLEESNGVNIIAHWRLEKSLTAESITWKGARTLLNGNKTTTILRRPRQ